MDSGYNARSRDRWRVRRHWDQPLALGQIRDRREPPSLDQRRDLFRAGDIAAGRLQFGVAEAELGRIDGRLPGPKGDLQAHLSIRWFLSGFESRRRVAKRSDRVDLNACQVEVLLQFQGKYDGSPGKIWAVAAAGSNSASKYFVMAGPERQSGWH